MIANNIFRALGNFFTDYAFAVYDIFRFTKGWWASNIVNTVIILIGFIAMFYWLSEMAKHKRIWRYFIIFFLQNLHFGQQKQIKAFSRK